MKRERLIELRERVFFDYQEWDVKCSKDGFQEATPTGKMDADGKDLTALIDAELARQSVTDDAVKRALIELGFETLFELESWWCKHGSLAIVALRQMRTEPCWYCKGIELHNIKSVKTVTDESGRELGAYDMPYNFCPNCGRKLVKDGEQK